MSTGDAELDSSFEVLAGKVLVVFLEMEIGSGEDEVLVFGFEGDGLVEIHEGEFGLMSFGFNLSTDGVKFGAVGMLVDEEGEACDGLLGLAGLLEEDGDTEESRVVVGLEGEEVLVIVLGRLVVTALLMDVGAIEEGKGVGGVDVEYLGVVEDGLVHIAQGEEEVGSRLEDGEVFGSDAQSDVVAVEGLMGFAFGQLHLGDVGVGEGIADVIRSQSKRLTKLFNSLVILLLMRRSKTLFDVELVSLGEGN